MARTIIVCQRVSIVICQMHSTKILMCKWNYHETALVTFHNNLPLHFQPCFIKPQSWNHIIKQRQTRIKTVHKEVVAVWSFWLCEVGGCVKFIGIYSLHVLFYFFNTGHLKGLLVLSNYTGWRNAISCVVILVKVLDRKSVV